MLSIAVSSLGFASTPIDQNPCDGSKPSDATFTNVDGTPNPDATIPNYFENKHCAEMMDIGFQMNLPQAGMDVTNDGQYGDVAADANGITPIMTEYSMADPKLCPVNVHWHLGTEHRSAGEYDESGSGPHAYTSHGTSRKLAAGNVRQGMLCHKYDASDAMYTTPYQFEYCDSSMEVGQTYEVHWPHSAAGDCGSKWQYQTPFYDGVFCNGGIISLGENPPFNVPHRVGVQAQVFTIVNSDDAMYQNDHLMDGAWMDTDKWTDVAKYVGSTTGTSRDNEVCSFYSPITWQVDRKCHLVSARSFDMMCKAMKEQADDMSKDLYAHGARELVNDTWSSDTLYRKK